MVRKITTKQLVFTALIAALYTALCLVLAPLSFGGARVAEALTLLPVLSPIGVWGVTLGCALSNLVGFFTGVNALGVLDVVFGTLATLLAALASRAVRNVRWKGIPILSAAPPVIFNAVIIGAELGWMMSPGEGFVKMFLVNAVQVGLAQLISCFALGLPLIHVLEKTGAARACFGDHGLRPLQNKVG